MAQKALFLTGTFSTGTWTAPADWPGIADSIECVGSGGTGGTGGGAGGGGGAYSLSLNVVLASGVSYECAYSPNSAGATGGNAWIGGSSLATSTVGAEGGSGGPTVGGSGGLASNGVGQVKFDGGTGGDTIAQANSGCGGGGGAGGRAGAGGNGGSVTGAGPAGGGGGGGSGSWAGAGGAGGSTSTTTGGNGGTSAGLSGGAGATTDANGLQGTQSYKGSSGGGGSGDNTSGTQQLNGGGGGSGSGLTLANDFVHHPDWSFSGGGGGGAVALVANGGTPGYGGAAGGGAGGSRGTAWLSAGNAAILIIYTPIGSKSLDAQPMPHPRGLSPAMQQTAAFAPPGFIDAPPDLYVPLTGATGTGAVGTLGVTLDTALTGATGTGAAGALGKTLDKALTGTVGTGAAGTLGKTLDMALTGTVGTGAVGSLGSTLTLALLGVTGTGALGAMIPDDGIVRTTGDVTTTGWTATPGAAFYAMLDEVVFDDADYITSPDLAAATPIIMQLGSTLAAGNWNITIRANFTGTSGQIRASLLDNTNTQQGVSGWQVTTASFAEYVLPVTTTGAATRIRFEVAA